MDKILQFELDDPDWGKTKILRPIPIDGDPWGQLASLKDTPWGKQIPIVSGEVFSHATHGDVVPLLRVIGPPPHALMRMIPIRYRLCDNLNNCINANPRICHPCPDVPDCYTPPKTPPDSLMAAWIVIMAWKEGRYVIIVEGPEFGYGKSRV